MKHTFLAAITSMFITLALSAGICAQEQPQFRVGENVEMKNLSGVWVNGKVIGILNEGRLYYRVKLDDENASTVYFNHALPSDIRARGGAPIVRGANPQAGAGIPVNAAAGAGETVDVYYDATRGWNRGKIVSRNGNNVRVHFNGCSRDEVVDRSLIHSPATVSVNAPSISFLFGRWALSKVGTSSSNTAWGRAEGVQISADGGYIWYQEANKPAVKGTWTTDAKVPGTDSGTQFYDGVLIKDATGRDWKVMKWSVKGYPDGIQVQRMCSGETIVGSRAR